jgi:hypothetical protein
LAEADADLLAAQLGDLPLVVDQAAALLADTDMTVQAYLDLLAEQAERLLDHGQGGGYPVSLAASWAVAFDRVAVDDPAALQLLSLVAWLAPEPVPLTLITQQPQRLPDPLAVAGLTAALRRRGMVRTTPDSLQLHRVPAALLRTRPAGDDPDSDRGGWPATAVRLLRQAAPADGGTTRRYGRPGGSCFGTSWPPPTPPATSTLSSTTWPGCWTAQPPVGW